MRAFPLPRVAAAVTFAVLASGVSVAATPAAAAPATSEVVLALAARSPAALAAAATGPAPASAAERRARLRAVAPTTAARERTTRWLRARGFTVTARTPWTITASGPAQRLGAAGVPLSLRRDVAGIARPSGRIWEPRAVPTGYGPPELHSAYANSGGGAGTTIATVQFSGWRAADAEEYAGAAGITLEPGQITSVSVQRARTTVPDGAGGDFEVALDVEAALAGAPEAAQRVYVAPNNATGTIAVYDSIASYAETTGLTAVSTSWGACEPDTDPALIAAVEQSLQRLLAAGATMFAASGDAGAFGCALPDFPSTRLAVDYPASSPHAVAVGGTSLTRRGDGWREVGWSTTRDSFRGFAGSGSGGGVSEHFDERPAWQAFIRGAPDARTVPDISAVADPETGLGIFAPYAEGVRGWVKAGGTSAGAPLSAGQLASALSKLGRTAGVGDIHPMLYAAAAVPGAFRDVTVGHNHYYRATEGYDYVTGLGSPQWDRLGPRLVEPALLAPTAWGSDTVPVLASVPTGMAASSWAVGEGSVSCAGGSATRPDRVALAPEAPDRVATVTLAVTLADGSCRTTSSAVRVDTTAPAAAAGLRMRRGRDAALSWSADEGAAGSGVESYAVTLRRLDGSVAHSRSARSAGGELRRLGPGTYRLEVSALDRVGHRSALATSSWVTVT